MLLFDEAVGPSLLKKMLLSLTRLMADLSSLKGLYHCLSVDLCWTGITVNLIAMDADDERTMI